MTEEVRKQLGEPKNDLERDTLAYIEPLVSEMIGEDIIGKGLTLKKCLEHCFEQGKEFEVRSGNRGVAKISEEQHFAWVREYFGIEGAATVSSETDVQKPTPEKPGKSALALDLDDLFD
ncbi:MAG: hypothetical protein NC299_09035 [Lachnospiraceae bacterium]|nr:hypothetical protein [Lachnospiraceae bacterium]